MNSAADLWLPLVLPLAIRKATKLASYVDDKMRELDPKGTLPQSKVSMLASLTIAGELMEERDRAEGSRREIARRLQHLHELLDEALGGS